MMSFAMWAALLAVSWARECDHCSCIVQDSTMLLDCSGEGLDFPMESIAMSDSALSLPEGVVSLEADFSRRGMKVLRSVVLNNLTSLDLSDNYLGDNKINVRAFQDVAATLLHLNLARNGFVTINVKVFQPLTALESLDLSGNKIVSLPDNAFPILPSLVALNLSDNQLSVIGDNVLATSFPALRSLDLSGNELKSLWAFPFLRRAGGIRSLSLARNKLISEDLKQLILLKNLERLDVSHNELNNFSSLPSMLSLPSVNEVNVNQCGITNLKSLLSTFPNVIKVSAHNNSITDMNSLASNQVKILNVSDNHIMTLPVDGDFTKLELLDLSGNNINTIPENLQGTSFPSLQTLILDRNPLTDVTFGSQVQFPRLRNLSISHVDTLKSIKAGAFGGLLMKPEDGQSGDSDSGRCPDGRLEQLVIANNENLENIDENALSGLNMCKIDLSGNALQEVSHSLIDWKNTKSVDLQNNPWNCLCSLNWILDEVMKPMYESGQPQMLYELRCNNPAHLRDIRMVHFYNKEQKQANNFCVKHSGRMIMKGMQTNADMEDSPVMAGSTIAVIVGVSLGALLLILVMIGVLLQRRNSKLMRARNRRF